MFTTNTSPNSREKAPVSARSRCPYADTTKERGRVTSDCSPLTCDCGTMRGRYSADGAASLAPFGRGADQFSRHAFFGITARFGGEYGTI